MAVTDGVSAGTRMDASTYTREDWHDPLDVVSIDPSPGNAISRTKKTRSYE